MLNLVTWVSTTHTLGDETFTFEVKRLNFLESKAFQPRANRMRLDVLPAVGRIFAAVTLAEKRVQAKRLRESVTAAGVEIGPLDLKVDEKTGQPTVTPEDATIARCAELIEAHGLEVPIPTGEEMLALYREQQPVLDEATAMIGSFFDSLDAGWVAQVFTDFVRNVDGLEADGVPVRTGAQLYEIADQQLVMLVLERVKALAELSAQTKNPLSLPPTSAPEARTPDGGSTVAPVVSADGPRLAIVTATPTAEPSSSASEAGPGFAPV